MYTNRRGRFFGREPGFTLIEILGVVAVLCILAAVLMPRVVTVIARGRVNATAQSLSRLKSATAGYLARNASIPARAGTGATDAAVGAGRFDADLVAGGFLEKLFVSSVGRATLDGSALTGRAHVRSLPAVPSATVSAPTATMGGDNFNLDRDTSTAEFTAGQMVISAFIPGVSLADAIALNKILDGDENTGAGADTMGRCLHSAEAADHTVTVYVYIGHH